MKVNLGAGHDIKNGYVNHDIANIDNINVVHDLNIFPWPWDDKSVDEIIAYDVLEHLNDFMKSMEELYRIMKPGGKLLIQVPYWNSWAAWADPTHKKSFNEFTFHFFDPNSKFNKERFYYSKSKFEIKHEMFSFAFISPYLVIPLIGKRYAKSKFSKFILLFFSNIFNNIILDIKLELKKI